MNEQQYRQEIKRTMKPMEKEQRLSMLGMGIAGEAGEIVDSLKKHVHHGHDLDRDDLIKELGDLQWYLGHLMNEFNISSEEVRERNIEKLKKRYPDGFSEEASKNRVDTSDSAQMVEVQEEPVEDHIQIHCTSEEDDYLQARVDGDELDIEVINFSNNTRGDRAMVYFDKDRAVKLRDYLDANIHHLK